MHADTFGGAVDDSKKNSVYKKALAPLIGAWPWARRQSEAGFWRGQTGAKNGAKNGLKITHEQIANDIASAREAVSRALKEMQKKGLVELKRGVVTLRW